MAGTPSAVTPLLGGLLLPPWLAGTGLLRFVRAAVQRLFGATVLRSDGTRGVDAVPPGNGLLDDDAELRLARLCDGAGSPRDAALDHLYATFGRSWDDEDFVDTEASVEQLVKRTEYYARRSGATDAVIAAMAAMIRTPEARYLLAIPSAHLLRRGVADLYKPKMHKVYAAYLRNVHVDFSLHVRKSVLPLSNMLDESPELFWEFARAVKLMDHAAPATQRDEWDALVEYAGFRPSDEQRLRNDAGVPSARLPPVAETQLVFGSDGEVGALASGFAESASHVETSLMQLVQQYTVRAQVRRLARRTGGQCRVSRLERLASSLGKLASTVSALNGGWHGLQVALFAGRRSSDRTFLLLQNLFCMRHLVGYVGTSSVQSAALVSAALRHAGKDAEACKAEIGTLLGTHAHELSCVFAQLLARFDDEAGAGADDPCQVSTLCAHLVFVLCNGGLEGMTALPDTYGTDGFCAAARAAELPPEFVEDMHRAWRVQLHSRSRVFDLIRLWRLDSGDYSTVARTVLRHNEARRAELKGGSGNDDGPPGPPTLVRFMHSNLGSADDVLAVSRLPAEIRPAVVGFGTLADGFAPIELAHSKVGSGSASAAEAPASEGGTAYWTTEASLPLVSVVMKAVQAYPMGTPRPTEACAGKLGDGGGKGKLELDPRVSPEVSERMRRRWCAMSAHANPDPARVSLALRRAYVAVTRDQVFNDGSTGATPAADSLL